MKFPHATVGLTLTLALLAAAAAQAHPVIKSADPQIDGTVTQKPKEIRIRFSEPLVPAFSGLSVSDRRGNVVAQGKGPDYVQRQELILPLAKPLTPGKYVVTWYAVAADTHRVKGRYSFQVNS